MRAFFSSRSDQLPTRQSQRVTLSSVVAVGARLFHPDPPHLGHGSLDTDNPLYKLEAHSLRGTRLIIGESCGSHKQPAMWILRISRLCDFPISRRHFVKSRNHNVKF